MTGKGKRRTSPRRRAQSAACPLDKAAASSVDPRLKPFIDSVADLLVADLTADPLRVKPRTR